MVWPSFLLVYSIGKLFSIRIEIRGVINRPSIVWAEKTDFAQRMDDRLIIQCHIVMVASPKIRRHKAVRKRAVRKKIVRKIAAWKMDQSA